MDADRIRDALEQAVAEARRGPTAKVTKGDRRIVREALCRCISKSLPAYHDCPDARDEATDGR